MALAAHVSHFGAVAILEDLTLFGASVEDVGVFAIQTDFVVHLVEAHLVAIGNRLFSLTTVGFLEDQTGIHAFHTLVLH